MAAPIITWIMDIINFYMPCLTSVTLFPKYKSKNIICFSNFNQMEGSLQALSTILESFYWEAAETDLLKSDERRLKQRTALANLFLTRFITVAASKAWRIETKKGFKLSHTIAPSNQSLYREWRTKKICSTHSTSCSTNFSTVHQSMS
jgi:hypothetical protein